MSGALSGGPVTDTTDAAGWYQVTLRSGEPRPFCALLEARGSDGRTGTDSVPDLETAIVLNPPDTVRVDLILR